MLFIAQKKSIGFSFRGWILIIVLFFGFMMFQVFTNFPLNILADFYGGAQQVAMLMTIGTRQSMLIATVMMIIAGILGVLATSTGAGALAATVTAALLFSGAAGSVNVRAVFIFEIALGIVGTILMVLFSAKHIREIDDKYREAAGKPLDDALVGRK